MNRLDRFQLKSLDLRPQEYMYCRIKKKLDSRFHGTIFIYRNYQFFFILFLLQSPFDPLLKIEPIIQKQLDLTRTVSKLRVEIFSNRSLYSGDKSKHTISICNSQLQLNEFELFFYTLLKQLEIKEKSLSYFCLKNHVKFGLRLTTASPRTTQIFSAS